MIDLTSRLLYGVKVETYWKFEDKKNKTFPVETLTYDMLGYYVGDDEWHFRMHYRPFLRQMSLMTEEELKELVNLNLNRINSYRRDFVIKETEFFLDTCWYVQIAYKDNNGDECVTNLYVGRGSSIEEIDWLNKKHFDYRGLIPRGLAIKAPKDMYK